MQQFHCEKNGVHNLSIFHRGKWAKTTQGVETPWVDPTHSPRWKSDRLFTPFYGGVPRRIKMQTNGDILNDKAFVWIWSQQGTADWKREQRCELRRASAKTRPMTVRRFTTDALPASSSKGVTPRPILKYPLHTLTNQSHPTTAPTLKYTTFFAKVADRYGHRSVYNKACAISAYQLPNW